MCARTHTPSPLSECAFIDHHACPTRGHVYTCPSVGELCTRVRAERWVTGLRTEWCIAVDPRRTGSHGNRAGGGDPYTSPRWAPWQGAGELLEYRRHRALNASITIIIEMPRNYELRIDAAYRVTRDATRFVSIMLSGGLFSFFSFRDNQGLWVIAWIDRGIFLSTNRLVVLRSISSFKEFWCTRVGELFLFFSFS